MPKVSAHPTKRAEISAEKARAKTVKDQKKNWRSADSFQNFVANLGLGTDNVASAGTYGFNPITRERTLLEWIHRGSWIAGLAVDLVADDMTRAGVEIKGTLPPDAMEAIDNEAQVLNIWGGLRDTIAWGRLYGGAIGVIMVDGQNYSTPLRPDTIGKGQFKGILALDRWMVNPSIEDLIQEPGPQIGLPKFYTVMANAPGLRMQKIHHSRCIRTGGNRLPYYQRTVENLWEQSILERLYDRLVAFDSTTQGAAQLVYKSYLRTYGIKDLRQVIAAGGDALNGLTQYVAMMAKFQSIEGITLLDSEDTFEAHQHSAFAGLAEVLIHLGQQISGAIQMPLVRLFGQSPAGLNSTGESDLRTYYDGIAANQHRELKVPVTAVYKMLAYSVGVKPPDDYGIKFRPLWLLTETERANIASTVTSAIIAGADAGVPQSTIFKELRQSAEVTGVWSNITDEDIAGADEMSTPPTEIEVAQIHAEGQEAAAEKKDEQDPAEMPPGFKPNGKVPEEEEDDR
jgi:phage-related protein (TIGR01555 family)